MRFKQYLMVLATKTASLPPRTVSIKRWMPFAVKLYLCIQLFVLLGCAVHKTEQKPSRTDGEIQIDLRDSAGAHVQMVGESRYELLYNGCKVVFYSDRNTGDGSWEVTRDGIQIYSETDGQFFPADYRDITHPDCTPSVHLTGAKDANLIVCKWDGSAHGGYDVEIFELVPTIKKIAIIDNVADGCFRDISGDGEMEFVTNDHTWDNWGGGCDYASSPVPQIIMEREGYRYRLSPKFMRAPKLRESEIVAVIERIHAATNQAGAVNKYEFNPNEIYREVLRRVYCGDSKAAQTIFFDTFQGTQAEKNILYQSLLNNEMKSPFFSEICSMDSIAN